MKLQSVNDSIFKIAGISYTKGDYVPVWKNLNYTNNIVDDDKAVPTVNIINKNTNLGIFNDYVSFTRFVDSAGTPYTDAETFALALATTISGNATSVGPTGPTGPQGPAGPAGLTWRGAWVSGTSYLVNDAVGYSGASYFCIANTSGTVTPNLATTDWALLASQGAVGPAGATGATGATGAQGPQGPAGGAGTLQQAVDNGNTVTALGGTTTTLTGSFIRILNPIYSTGISLGQSALGFIRDNGSGTNKTLNLVVPTNITDNRTITLPDASGTVALTNIVSGYNRLTLSASSVSVLDENTLLGNVLYKDSLRFNRDNGSGTTKRIDLLSPTNIIDNRTITLPDASGTVALTSDITGAQVTKVVKTTITSAQVLQLFTTPVTILDSNNPLTVAYPISIYIKRNNGTPYGLGTNQIQIINDFGTALSVNINSNPLGQPEGFTQSAVSTNQNVSGSGAYKNLLYKLKASSSNPTLGTGDLDVYVTYIEITL